MCQNALFCIAGPVIHYYITDMQRFLQGNILHSYNYNGT